MKSSRQTVWRIGAPALLVAVLLLVCIPWQRVWWYRVKVPVLIKCFRHGPGEIRGYAAIFLAHSDGNPKMMVSVLLPGLKDKDEGVREMTAIALGDIHQYPEKVVPALFETIDAETNAASLVPMYGVSAVGYFGTNAKPWSPILVQMIESNRFGFWSSSALSALKKIDPETHARLVQKREFMRTNAPSTNQSH